MKFTKTLKFRLTMWYTLVFTVFFVAFLFTVNVLLTKYMTQLEPSDNFPRIFKMDNNDWLFIENLPDDTTDIIMQSRLTDLQNIRKMSLYLLIPLFILSFAGGYFLASVMLEPLDDLNKVIKKKEMANLADEIEFEDNDDEISDIIKSFNRMNNRLSRSFDSQKQFVENASHELKTPLALIQANLDMAMEDGMVTKEEMEDLLSNCKKHVKFMNDLIEDLLILSVNGEIKTEVVNLVSVLEDIAKTSSKKNFKVNFYNNIKKSKIDINANEVLLRRSFMNIIENSMKYSGGNRLDITLKKSNERKYVIISLKDNGSGVPEEHASKIFDRFYRVDKGRSRKQGGTGLGLSISKKVVEAHKGYIYYNLEFKDGAEFVVCLPVI